MVKYSDSFELVCIQNNKSQTLMQNETVFSGSHQVQKISHIHTPHTIINKKGTKYSLFSKPKPKIFSQQHMSSLHQTMPSTIKCQKLVFFYNFNDNYSSFDAQKNINKNKQDSALTFDNKVVTSSNKTFLNMLKYDRTNSAKKKQYRCFSINSQQTSQSKKKLIFDKNQYTCKLNQLPLKVTSSQVLSTCSASRHSNVLNSIQSSFKPKKHLQDAKSIVSQVVSSQSMQLSIDQSQVLERKLDIFDFVTPIQQSRCCNMCKAVDKRFNSLITFKIFTGDKLDCYFRQVKIMQMFQQLQPNMFIRAKQTLIQKLDSQNNIIVLFQPFNTTLSEFIRKIDNPYLRNKVLELINLQLTSTIKNLVQKGIHLNQNLQFEDFVESEGAWKIRCLCKFKLVNAAQQKKVNMAQELHFLQLK